MKKILSTLFAIVLFAVPILGHSMDFERSTQPGNEQLQYIAQVHQGMQQPSSIQPSTQSVPQIQTIQSQPIQSQPSPTVPNQTNVQEENLIPHHQ